MTDYIPSFTDISDWNKDYTSTGGTRAKKIYSNHLDKDYFFKGSKIDKNGGIKYPTEFWSEIVASKIGQWLGFQLLDYNIGYDKNDRQKIGCLSESMVNSSQTLLIEGIDFLRETKSNYNPKKDEDKYTLDFILETFRYFRFDSDIEDFIKMLIFDAIIGNSDRHQENWGFIKEPKILETDTAEDNNCILSLFKLFSRLIINKYESRNLGHLEIETPYLVSKFSPIYDSGCSLGRELEIQRLENFLKDRAMLEKYIDRGKSEVRVNEGSKNTHWSLMELLKREYNSIFESQRLVIQDKYNKEDLTQIINNIDSQLPKGLIEFRLEQLRKDLMVQLIDLRIEKLMNL